MLVNAIDAPRHRRNGLALTAWILCAGCGAAAPGPFDKDVGAVDGAPPPDQMSPPPDAGPPPMDMPPIGDDAPPPPPPPPPPDVPVPEDDGPPPMDVVVPPVDVTQPPARTLRVYVSGESIERRNRYVAAPFNADGTLNARGGGAARNDDDEYGWMVPMAERLRLRAPDLRLEFVGAQPWANAEDAPYTGTFPRTPGRTSAISGTDIASWLAQRRGELTGRRYCYEVAFVSRGGNDFGNTNDADYQRQLAALIELVAAGSSCRPDPVVYVTGHMPDDNRGGGGPGDATYVSQQVQRFVTRVQRAVADVRARRPTLRVHFVDQYTPFLENRPTRAFPAERWSTNRVPDYVKIGRVGDTLHPRRLASIYAGELAADAMDLDELRALAP